MQVGVDVPQLFDGFQAVPTRRHAHVDEHQGVGGVGGQGLVHQFQGFLALIGGIQHKGLAHRRSVAEQGFFNAVQGGVVVGVDAQDLAEVRVDRRRVIDDQDASIGPP